MSAVGGGECVQGEQLHARIARARNPVRDDVTRVTVLSGVT